MCRTHTVVLEELRLFWTVNDENTFVAHILMVQYALIDCNNFYVSCERLFAPNLCGKPVVVLSNNDGCVISRSNEAKKLGVPMTAPEFKWRAFFKQHNVQVLSSNYELYGDMSNRVYRALQSFSPTIEKYSIDESFLLLPRHIKGKTLKEELHQHIGIPVSVGVGSTKTLAKAANHLAKNRKGYSGVCYMPTGAVQDEILYTMPVKKLWGIGRKWARKLSDHGIKNVRDLKYTSDSWAKKHLNVVGLRIIHELQGTPCLDLEEVVQKRKHSICTQSFGRTVVDLAEMKEAVSTFASTASERIRRQNLTASLLHIFISTNRHSKGPKINLSYDTAFSEPTSSGTVITKSALKCLELIFQKGYKYSKAGVILSGLENNHASQIDLFSHRDKKKDEALMDAFDQINTHYGRGSVKIGSEGIQKPWVMKREFKSPNYTTRFNALKEVH